jgi:membrane protease YdiL (CAAX protease family)
LEQTEEKAYVKRINRSLYLFVVLLAFVTALGFIPTARNWKFTLLCDAIFSGIVILFFLFEFKSCIKLFVPRNLNFKLVGGITVLMMIYALLVFYLAGIVNTNLFGIRGFSYYSHFWGAPFRLLLTLVSIAVVPAVFEELAIRGILYNYFKDITTVRSNIIITSIAFTFLHLSLISFVWIFPLGLFFGFLRSKHETIFYGIAGHFIFNATQVFLELIFY